MYSNALRRSYNNKIIFPRNNYGKVGLNNILFIIRNRHAYILTIQLTIGSDGKHSAI